MPAYYDEKTKKWYCKFYYVDFTGVRKQKLKRGFDRKKDAQEYERIFLEKQTKDINMTFESFLELYLDDQRQRLKPKTLLVKENIINNHILPYFKTRNMNDITAVDIRQWQNILIKEKNFSDAYFLKIHAQLNAIFSHAVKFYELKTNPCSKAGSIGSHKSKEMKIYTLDEFNKLIEVLNDPIDKTIFTTLFFTGMRKGELFALQRKDIDLENGIIDINKSYQRIDKQNIIGTTKTPKSVRKINIPQFLCNTLNEYISAFYDVKDSTYIFMDYYVRTRGRLINAYKKANLKPIRIHDFRHSHASLLIEMGYSPLLIAERLGDTVETTMNTYSHLYPNKQSELVKDLDKIIVSK